MKELFEAIEAELSAGKNAVLATIVSRRGSAPRGVGVSMTVSQDGAQTGTVGGGSMEYCVRMDALELLRQNTAQIRAYEIRAGEEGDSSGSVSVLFRPFLGERGNALVRRILCAVESDEEAFLVCELSDDGSFPSAVWAADELRAETGIDPPEHALVTEGEHRYLIEPLNEAPRVVLFGGGHVAQVMARQLGFLDYRVWVVEDRVEFAKTALFPAAERVIQSDYNSAEDTARLTKRDHVIVMSRGHETDYEILRWVLRSDADYIGCIGSKRKIATIHEKLSIEGVEPNRIDRLHAPIGLSIGAETPAEIAVSVAAELIQYCAGKRHL